MLMTTTYTIGTPKENIYITILLSFVRLIMQDN